MRTTTEAPMRSCPRMGGRSEQRRVVRRVRVPAATAYLAVRSQDCAAWRHLDRGNASAIEHHEAVAMLGANHASVSPKRFDHSLDYLVLVNLVMLIPDV